MGCQIRVLLVDDHFIVRQGIRALLLHTEDVTVVGEAGDGEQAVELARRLAPDVVLMDLLMPGMGGVEAIRRIRAERPEARILILTGNCTEDEVVEAIGEGALGYVAKDAGVEECLGAIRKVYRGEPCLPAALTRRLLEKLRSAGGEGWPVEHLTPRETEILRLVAAGWDDQEIARALSVSKGTVRTHVSNVLGKLGLKNRVEAALYALRQGLVSLEEQRGAGF